MSSPGAGDGFEVEGQTSGAGGDAYDAPNVGPVSGGRGPMLVTLVVLAVVTLAVAVIVGASFFPS